MHFLTLLFPPSLQTMANRYNIPCVPHCLAGSQSGQRPQLDERFLQLEYLIRVYLDTFYARSYSFFFFILTYVVSYPTVILDCTVEPSDLSHQMCPLFHCENL